MEPLSIALDAVRLALLTVVFAYAAYSDHKTEEVRNKLWLYAFFGLALTFTSIYLNPETALPSLLSMGASTLLAFILFYMGGCGGADSKALLTLAASMPLAPFGKAVTSTLFMYPLTVLVISSIIAFVIGLTMWIRKPNGKKFMEIQVRFLPYMFVCLFIALFL